jgi:predicted outer membrane protein
VGYITKQYPVKVNTIDESSVEAQPKVLDNIYIQQMKMKHKDLNNSAHPLFADQHTNAHVRGAKAL